jgi:hypothetical protein
MPPEEQDEITVWFIGEVSALGQEPPFWSDRYSSWQTVQYRVVEVLKGKPAAPTLAVEHGVVKSRPTARKDRPGLSPEVVRPSSRWIIGAQDREGTLYVLFEMPWTPEGETEIRNSLRALAP